MDRHPHAAASTVRLQNVSIMRNASATQERSAWKAAAPVNVGTRSVQAFSADRYDKQEADAAGIRLFDVQILHMERWEQRLPGVDEENCGVV